MSTDRGDLVHALFEHLPDNYDENDIGIFADELIDCNALDDAETFAHIVWTMGAAKTHEGCRYGGDDANDGDYSNECPECEAYLTGIAVRVLAALDTKPEEEPSDVV